MSGIHGYLILTIVHVRRVNGRKAKGLDPQMTKNPCRSMATQKKLLCYAPTNIFCQTVTLELAEAASHLPCYPI